MKEVEARQLVETVFSSGFEESKFGLFARNLLHGLDEGTAFDLKDWQIKESFKDHISRFKRLGTYRAPDGSRLDILVVALRRERTLDRARTMQRNLIANHLSGGEGADAALVAFYAEGNSDDWRFSFVRIEYSSELGADGKVKVSSELSPAKRCSFLVGQNEPHHTALQRLWPLLLDGRGTPTIRSIEEAFSIESVTKEFFENYKEQFLVLKEEIDRLIGQHPRIAAEFQSKAIDTGNFTKKLLGQIVFLYFIQKKGWLGVQKDESGSFKPWGTGPKDFLQRIFRDRSAGTNFFDDVLEPLFYEALARERDSHYYHPFRCRIPFLNGGLFEAMNEYNWREVDIPISDAIFERLFDAFDMFNFTVREDEPLDKEVAVDPEMLGKVFENLLEVKDRKSKGAYYTPREVVHYMCQESLIHYLAQKLPEVSIKTIEYFIRHGQSAVENETAKVQGSASFRFAMPVIMANAPGLDLALADIRICDPAIGSGAFPVGMLTEIVNARQTLTAYVGASAARTAYEFKRHAITTCIYGVDIDGGAVDIAKLRLWLSLVVDEDDFETIRPLPNLDFKIVRGNSLSRPVRNSLNTHLFDQAEALKSAYVEETALGRKRAIKEKIDQLMVSLTGGSGDFDYWMHFSEVFAHRQGFDVVIANPPYVRHEGIKSIKPELSHTFGDFFCGTADLYTYFYKRGMELLKPQGHLCFIAPNKFMRAAYGKSTRNLLSYFSTPIIVIDFGDLPIFNATTYPSILLVQKEAPRINSEVRVATFYDVEQVGRIAESLGSEGFCMPIRDLKPDGWNLARPEVLNLMNKLRGTGKPLGQYVQNRFYRGILTGLNEAFVIDEQTRARLIAEDPHSAELIKPWLRGKDIGKWITKWAGLYLIVIESSGNKPWAWSEAGDAASALGIFMREYPAIARHLQKWQDALIARDDSGRYWWELRSCSYWEEFAGNKIVYPDIAQTPEFAWDETGSFLGNTAYIIPTDELWLVGLLNSSVIWWFYKNVSSSIRGGFVRFIAQYMETLPIPNATEIQKSEIEQRVRRIIENPSGPEVRILELEIDDLVYKLFNLTPDDVRMVAGH